MVVSLEGRRIEKVSLVLAFFGGALSVCGCSYTFFSNGIVSSDYISYIFFAVCAYAAPRPRLVLDHSKRTCPGALVPTLIPIDTSTGKPDESKSVYESIVTIEYIDQVSGATGKDRLISDDPFYYAVSNVFRKKCCVVCVCQIDAVCCFVSSVC